MKDDSCVDHVVVGQVLGAQVLANINLRTDVQPKLSQTSFSELADSLSKRDCLLEQDNLTHVLLQGALSNPLRMSGSPKYKFMACEILPGNIGTISGTRQMMKHVLLSFARKSRFTCSLSVETTLEKLFAPLSRVVRTLSGVIN